MNWAKIEHQLRNCVRGEAAASVPSSVSQEYAEVLRRHNGIEGFVGSEQYVILWPAKQVAELNEKYSTSQFAPGIVLIGTDGSDTGFGLDERGNYISVPLVGMCRSTINELAGTFEGFLERIAAEN